MSLSPVTRPRVSLVIPVYNSLVVEELVERIGRVFESRSERFEIILVDDASTRPQVWPLLERLARQRPEVKAIRLTRNFGQQAATLCGLRASLGDFVITMDDDLQHRPEDLPRFLGATQWDIVIGQFAQKKHSLFKRITSRLKGLFDRIILNKPKHIQLTSYRMLSRNVVEGMLTIGTPNPFIPALMFHVSRNVGGVPVAHQPRREGKTGYSLWKLIRVFSNLVINNSSLVLRLVGHVGLVLACVSFFMVLVVVRKKLVYGVPIAGWTSVMATLLLIGGLLLFSLAVVGEYLVRIIESSEKKPAYHVQKRLGFEDEVEDRPAQPAASLTRSSP